MLRFRPIHLLPALMFSAAVLPQAAAARQDDPKGIPINDGAMVRNCAACHVQDSSGMLSRLSYMRKTPEGWQTSIRRMVALHDVELDPEVAREIVKYLSNYHGLAPEELRPGMFEVERRMIDYTYEADEETETTCKQCHSLGRVITQRRTREEWGLLLTTHRSLYPVADFQAFRRFGPPEEGDDSRHPMDKAADHLAKEFPLETPEWTAWSTTMRPPRLAGTWLLSGHELGSGRIYGRVVITANPNAPDAFTTETTFSHARGRKTVTRQGRALVYTGFQWRGRSFERSGDDVGMREVMLVERDWRVMSGRWFTGNYDEIGLDVTLRRIGGDPIVAGVHPQGIRTSGSAQEVRIFGANLPANLSATDVDFGPGVEVTGVSNVSPDGATARVNVAEDATLGMRDLFVAGAILKGAVAVYEQVDRIRVTPQAGMARVGGANFPKQFQQFEAVAYSDGADGEADTDDDLNLGVVDVTWSLEEYSVTYDDDDIDFVGAIDGRGMFTPAEDGPNPNRSGNRNNVGDVWVVATYGAGAGPIVARAHLLVTVPLYIRFEPWRAIQ